MNPWHDLPTGDNVPEIVSGIIEIPKGSYIPFFQSQNGLPPSGVVDVATWKSLGPLEMSEEPAPEPAVVNVDVAKEPVDPLDGGCLGVAHRRGGHHGLTFVARSGAAEKCADLGHLLPDRGRARPSRIVHPGLMPS